MTLLARNTKFLRLLGGRLITNAGDSLYFVAAMWLVHSLGGSTFYTGLAGALIQAPQALQFLTGPIADRTRLRRLLVATQIVQGVLVVAIPVAAVLGILNVWFVLLVMPILSMLNQFVYPALDAALPRLVPDEQLVRANSLFSIAYQGVDMVFNAVGGLLIAFIGAVTLFLVDSVTFIAASLLFATVYIPQPSKTGSDPGLSEDGMTSSRAIVSNYKLTLIEGLRFVRDSVIGWILIRAVVVNFAVSSMMAVLPAFAAEQGGSEVYGILLATISAGIFVGSISASVFERFSMSALNIGGHIVSGVVWLAAVSVSGIPTMAILFFVAWIPVGVTNVIFRAAVQSGVPKDRVGRVSAISMSVVTAAAPLGSLLGGTAGEIWGSRTVVAALGPVFLLVAVYWILHPALRELPTIEQMEF